MKEKSLSYKITNTYSTLNERTAQTKNIWIVFHGIGYLSRYFLKHFKMLNPEENYVIAPQAASKYYLNNEYRHVGASWLTKENTEVEIKNILNYLDEIYKVEELQDAQNLIVLGYSQGVSIATRWISRRKINPAQLIIHSGKIPSELISEDFQFLRNTQVRLIYGTKDPYLDQKILKNEEKRAKQLFREQLEILPFEGGHEVNEQLISEFV